MRNNDDEKLRYIRDLYCRDFESMDLFEIPQRPQIQIGAEEGKLLYLLTKLHNAKSILEIGTFFGYSAYWMAKALPAEGRLTTIEKDLDNYNLAKKNFKTLGLEDKIQIINEDAKIYLEHLVFKSEIPKFDLIFIDANKSAYLDYLKYSEKLLCNGGMLIADNTLLFDIVFNGEKSKIVTDETIKKMQEFNIKLSDKNKYITTMIPTKSGLTIAIKIS